MKTALAVMVLASLALFPGFSEAKEEKAGNEKKSSDVVFVQEPAPTQSLYAETIELCGDMTGSVPPGTKCSCGNGYMVSCGNTTHDCQMTSLQSACRSTSVSSVEP